MSSYVITRTDDYLMHHGIKGQKWGIRRFENPDGTLTEEGKKRYKSGAVSKDEFKEFRKLYNKADRASNIETRMQFVGAGKHSRSQKSVDAANAFGNYTRTLAKRIAKNDPEFSRARLEYEKKVSKGQIDDNTHSEYSKAVNSAVMKAYSNAMNKPLSSVIKETRYYYPLKRLIYEMEFSDL